jgi:hypothetical protein
MSIGVGYLKTFEKFVEKSEQKRPLKDREIFSNVT